MQASLYRTFRIELKIHMIFVKIKTKNYEILESKVNASYERILYYVTFEMEPSLFVHIRFN